MSLEALLNEDVTDLDLVGVEEDEMDQLIDEVGALERRSPRRKRYIRRLSRRTKRPIIPTNNLMGKAEFEKRFKMLPNSIQQDLRKGNKQLVDMNFYTIVDFSSTKYKELMANADTKTIGLANVNGRKLDANTYFLLTGIQLQSAVYTSNVHDGSFGLPVANFLNGEFKLEVGNKIIIPTVSCAVFDSNGRADVPKGFWKLDNPKMIQPQTEIVPELYTPEDSAANTAVKLTFWGVGTVKA